MSKQLLSKYLLLCSNAGVPVATDVITTANKPLVNPKTDSKEYEDAGAGAGSKKTIINPDLTTVDFSPEVTARAASAAGDVPACAPLLKLCGLKETIEAGVSATYTPELVGTSGTAKVYVDGEVRTITGMAGNFTISGKIGELVKFGFKLKGFTTIEPEYEDNPAVTLDSNNKLLLYSATVITESGANIDLQSFDLDAGMEVEELYGAETKVYFIKDFKSTLKIKAIKTKDNKDHWTQLKNNTIKEMVFVFGNEDEVGKKMEIRASYCNASSVDESDDKGIMVFEKTYLCESSVGGDNFSIKYF